MGRAPWGRLREEIIVMVHQLPSSDFRGIFLLTLCRVSERAMALGLGRGSGAYSDGGYVVDRARKD